MYTHFIKLMYCTEPIQYKCMNKNCFYLFSGFLQGTGLAGSQPTPKFKTNIQQVSSFENSRLKYSV